MNYEVLASTIYILIPLLSKNSLIVLYNDWLVQPYEHSKKDKTFLREVLLLSRNLKINAIFSSRGQSVPSSARKVQYLLSFTSETKCST